MRKPLAERHLEDQTTFPAVKMQFFFSVFCGDVLRFFYCTKSDGAERGEHRNMSKQLLKPWCAWNRMCRTNHIFSDTKENAKQKTKNKKQLPERQLEHQSAFPLSNACFMFCFKCLSATLQKWEKNKSAYMGMFHTSYISLDVRTTECVGQKIRSVMFPVSKQC